MDIILVIDIGTSSMRGGLYDEYGKIKKIIQIHYSPEYFATNRVEQDPIYWENALIQITSEAVQWLKTQGLPLEAISITSQRTSIIPVDRSGSPLHNAIMWQDKRTYNICEELKLYDAFVYNRSGAKINPVFTAPKIKWLKENEPNIYKSAHKILVIPDYAIFLMTGKFVTDYTYGSRTSLMNIHELEWDNELLELFKVDREKLCELIPQGSIAGYTTEMFMKRTGLPSGTPVISAGGDQQCAALGAGAIGNGSFQITTGTGSYIIASSNTLQLDSQMRTICSVSAVKSKYMLESSILTTSTICNWFCDNFYANSKGDSAFERMLEDALVSPVGSNNLITFPHFQGRGSPDWNSLASGIFFNVSLGTTRGDFARSILEAIALEISENLDIMNRIIGTITSISTAGGLTKSSLFNQIQADIYNQPISLPNNRETTSLGAWVTASLEMGMYDSYQKALNQAEKGTRNMLYYPISENVVIYDKQKLRRLALYNNLEQNGIYQLLREDGLDKNHQFS
ncbi:FGGY-family carbohydrate kinase [Virgibacillus necropolis]|uniref:Glycerol kinase n=1 Tax=Virgibacillus necropolis TaxID=163877 RepID=A0A221MGB9_9BACI|nr:FGGY-family carbohydrate kinase [Virgibacillus necropolis]ASN06697.1 glycerol kinase [Virgibacillus necropolis]